MSAVAAPQFVPIGSCSRRIARVGLSAALVVLAASIAALLLMPRYSRPVAPADVGTTAPDFALRDASGQTVSLADQRGKVVVLLFTSPREAAANYEARLEKLAQQYASDSRVTFLGIDERSLSRPIESTAAAVAALLAADTVGERSFPTLKDDRGAVALRYGADTFPMIVMVDPRGQVRYRGPFDDNPDVAFTTRNFCADALREVLGGAPTASLAAIPAKTKMEDGR